MAFDILHKQIYFRFEPKNCSHKIKSLIIKEMVFTFAIKYIYFNRLGIRSKPRELK